MGNRNSNSKNEEKQPLLNDYEGIEPIFRELKLVLIGGQGVGKNSIGNEIFRKKVFTFWTFRKNVEINVTKTVLGRKIKLTRTAGWKENSKESKILNCVHSIYETEPHAVLLALKVESELPEQPIQALENVLSVQLWSHTIVIFTNGEKLRGRHIEDYISCNNLQSLIDKCGQRYLVLKKTGTHLIETIEDFIASKDSTTCFKPHDQKKTVTSSDLIELVTKIRSKIASISNFTQKLKKQKQKQDIKQLLDTKDAEIERLNKIVREKEEKIKILEISLKPDEGNVQLKKKDAEIKELKERIDLKNKELVQKNTEIEELTKTINILHKENRRKYLNNVHAGYRCNQAQDAKPVNQIRPNEIPLQDLPSNDTALYNWSITLLKILNELTDPELKKLIYMMKWNSKYKIEGCFIGKTDRTELADNILSQWAKRESILKTRDLIKKIPRNGEIIINLFSPVLNEIGETW